MDGGRWGSPMGVGSMKISSGTERLKILPKELFREFFKNVTSVIKMYWFGMSFEKWRS